MLDDETRPHIIGFDPSLTGFGVSDGEQTYEISTFQIDGEDREIGLQRRCTEIVDRLDALYSEAPLHVYMEAPALRNMEHGGHLYEVGWLY